VFNPRGNATNRPRPVFRPTSRYKIAWYQKRPNRVEMEVVFEAVFNTSVLNDMPQHYPKYLFLTRVTIPRFPSPSRVEEDVHISCLYFRALPTSPATEDESSTSSPTMFLLADPGFCWFRFAVFRSNYYYPANA
jgi:hypothetical protein